ncbi:MAG: MFS transporter [Chloroflexota bacterium]
MKTINIDKPKRAGFFYGWWLVIASGILQFFSGVIFYDFAVFFNPIRQTFGWTATAMSAAFTLRGLETGILGPVVGFLVDKVGSRKLMLFGWGCIGLGFVLMGRINSLWSFYGTFMVVSLGVSFGTNVVMNACISNWFRKKRSRALAIVYIGPGLSGLIAPLFALSITQVGWRTTLIILGIVLWIIGLPLCLLYRDKPSQYGYLPDGENRGSIPETDKTSHQNRIVKPGFDSPARDFTVKAALKTRVFWLLSFIFFLQQLGASAVNVHIVANLESIKMPTAIAAGAVTGLTLCSLIGRAGFGFLGDFINKRYLLTLSFALTTIGVFLLSFIEADRMWLLVLFSLTFGAGFGAPIPLKPALQADYFGMRSYGTILGLLTLASTIGGLASPIIAGRIFDVPAAIVWHGRFLHLSFFRQCR